MGDILQVCGICTSTSRNHLISTGPGSFRTHGAISRGAGKEPRGFGSSYPYQEAEAFFLNAAFREHRQVTTAKRLNPLPINRFFEA